MRMLLLLSGAVSDRRSSAAYGNSLVGDSDGDIREDEHSLVRNSNARGPRHEFDESGWCPLVETEGARRRVDESGRRLLSRVEEVVAKAFRYADEFYGEEAAIKAAGSFEFPLGIAARVVALIEAHVGRLESAVKALHDETFECRLTRRGCTSCALLCWGE